MHIRSTLPTRPLFPGRAMLRTMAVTLAIMLTCAAPAHAGFAEGKTAFEAKNWPLAILNLRPAAENGNAEAMFYLGTMYLNGWGVEQNPAIAQENYRAAANGYHPDAMLALATLYGEGVGVDRNPEVSRYWFEQSAKFGNPIAHFVLGLANLGGRSEFGSKNWPAAYTHFSLLQKTPADPKLARVKSTGLRMMEGLEKQISADELAAAKKAVDDYVVMTPEKAAAEKYTFTQPEGKVVPDTTPQRRLRKEKAASPPSGSPAAPAPAETKPDAATETEGEPPQ